MYDYNYGYDYGIPSVGSSGLDIGGSSNIISDILAGMAIAGIVILLLSLVITILLIVSNWKIFEKAKRTGWESIVPIHNLFVLLEIAGTPTWHIFLFFVPFANVYAVFRMYIDLAHQFGKSTGFGVLTVLFNIICLPILAFSKNAKYAGQNNEQETKPVQEASSLANTEETMNQSFDTNMPVFTANMNPAEEIKPIETQEVPKQMNEDFEATFINAAPINPNQQPEQFQNQDVPVFTPITNIVENVVPLQNPEIKMQETSNAMNNSMNQSAMNFGQPMNEQINNNIPMYNQNMNNVVPSQPAPVTPMQQQYTEPTPVAPTPNMVQSPVTNQQDAMSTQNNNQNIGMM